MATISPSDTLRAQCIKVALSTDKVLAMIDTMVATGEFPRTARWATLSETRLQKLLHALECQARREANNGN